MPLPDKVAVALQKKWILTSLSRNIQSEIVYNNNNNTFIRLVHTLTLIKLKKINNFSVSTQLSLELK